MEASSSESSITSMPVDHNMSDILRPSFSEISVSDIDSFAIHSESSEISTVEPSLSESNVSLAGSTITNSQQLVSPQLWNGFRIIGDNIDKNVKPRFYRMESQVRSLHYYHSYALLDRIDLSAASDSRPAKVCS